MERLLELKCVGAFAGALLALQSVDGARFGFRFNTIV
jgi:hypothetical protein